MTNQDDCYIGPERRDPCSELLVLRQRVEDEEIARQEWHESVDERFSDINIKLERILNFTRKIEGPYNFGIRAGWIFIGAVILGFTGFLFKFSGKIIKWFLG